MKTEECTAAAGAPQPFRERRPLIPLSSGLQIAPCTMCYRLCLANAHQAFTHIGMLHLEAAPDYAFIALKQGHLAALARPSASAASFSS